MRADWPFAVLLALYVLVALVVLWPDRGAGRRRRRGGYIRLSSRASTSGNRATAEGLATSTVYRLVGQPPEGWEVLLTPVPPSSDGARGCSGDLTETDRGGRMTAVRGLAEGADLSPFDVALLDYYTRDKEY